MISDVKNIFGKPIEIIWQLQKGTLYYAEK